MGDQGKCRVLFMLKQTSANTFDLNTDGRLCTIIGDNGKKFSDVLVDKTITYFFGIQLKFYSPNLLIE
jgi:hypothetical protein